MSILIRGMEMPTSCGKCKLFDASHAIGLFAPLGWCRVNGKEIFRLSEKADFCPLVPVPPHGRLIDADALHSVLRLRAKEFSNSEYGEGVKCGLADAREFIKIAPTIIPESEEG